MIHMNAVQITESSATSAPLRINDAVIKAGVQSVVLVHDAVRGFGDRAGVVKRPGLVERRLDVLRQKKQRKLLLRYPDRDPVLFSPGLSGIDISNDNRVIKADIVNLHWVCMGYLRPESVRALFRAGKKVIWTMHDCWPMSGGCHYGCERFTEKCGCCPVLHSDSQDDLSGQLLEKKLKLWEGLDIVTVSPSLWLKSRADRSAVFGGGRNEYIPNPIDTDVFRMKERSFSEDGTIRVLFGASDASSPYKGFEYFEKMLLMLCDRDPELAGRIVVVTFGSGDIESSALKKFRYEPAGFVKGEGQMAGLYGRADIMVAPSVEDNFPGTVLESMSCGTPVLGFDTGGIPDMVDSAANGYIAPRGDAEGLYSGFKWICEHNDGNVLGKESRKKVMDNFTMDIIGKRYRELYEEIVTAGTGNQGRR